MTETNDQLAATKRELKLYLQDARAAVVWKLEGLSEYDARRPLTPTGTNLLGLVKHLTGAEAVYFGTTFGRPFPDGPGLWVAGEAEPNADLWARPEEGREALLDGYRRVWAHADATIDELPLDAVGKVPWPPHSELTLGRVLLHVVAETHRHAGHADLVRELVDGATGLRPNGSVLPDGDAAWWSAHHAHVEHAARTAATAAGEQLPD
ncbi:DinB family protein [Kitasatospora sp. NA04385]|uniref:DinB family protein n=1 Tax=Kitasatospora sp. NA04385 TaxID=2742135 RepID=UPI00159280A5|nr:DinB family protein [Kitasatospora sp. NA04385]QKW23799.1 DinB family protein [Kitasatospora sp. NA04385]